MDLITSILARNQTKIFCLGALPLLETKKRNKEVTFLRLLLEIPHVTNWFCIIKLESNSHFKIILELILVSLVGLIGLPHQVVIELLVYIKSCKLHAREILMCVLYSNDTKIIYISGWHLSLYNLVLYDWEIYTHILRHHFFYFVIHTPLFFFNNALY